MALTKSPQTLIATYEKQLDQALGKYPVMLKLERKVGIPKARLVGGAAILIVGYALLQLAASMLISSIIFGFPAYMTMKALESGSKVDHSAWLAYWTAAALFQLLESFSGNALAKVIPLYSILKIAFHLWLSLPFTQGSLIVYETLLRPTYRSLVSNPQFAAATEKIGNVATKLQSEATKVTAEAASKIAATASAIEKEGKKDD